MAEISAGVFFMFVFIAFISIIFSLRGGVLGTSFRLVSVIMFFAVSVIMFGGYDVTFVEVSDETGPDGAVNTTTTQYVIGDELEEPASMSQQLGWVFLSIAIILAMLFLVDALRGNI